MSFEPLKGAWEKCHRAREHLETLYAESRAEERTIGVRTEFDPHDDMCSFVVETLPEAKLRWSVIVGDVVYNLRSALDQAVCAAVIVNGGDCEAPPSQFPITTRRKLWRDPRTRRMVSQLPRKQRAIVRRSQPYKASGGPVGHPLAILQEWSNRDKHRLPNLMFVGIDAEASTAAIIGVDAISHTTMFTADPLEIGTHAMSTFWIPDGPNPEVTMEGDLVGQIVFDFGIGVYAGLNHVTNYVAVILADLEETF